MSACFAALNPSSYRSHRLHGEARLWPLTNCYIDLWIEVLAAVGATPEAMFGFTLEQDFEGDQFTFSKPSPNDLHALFGVQVQELAVYDRIEDHIRVQLERGRICLVEVDSFYLPDTEGLSYRREHGKTTIAVNRITQDGARLEYFHNGGYFPLEGDDLRGLLVGYATGEVPFLPFSEFVKFGPAPGSDQLRERAVQILNARLDLAPRDNPIARFAQVLPQQAEGVADRGQGFYHLYAFNTLRQLGANFELLGDHLDWLARSASPGGEAARVIAKTAKAAQFQLARACAKRRFEPLSSALDTAISAYDALRSELASGVA